MNKKTTMLICNNCNTVNDDHSTKCGHCQMSGNFRRQMGENRSDNTPVIQPKMLCRNCGSDAPGEGAKCTHCHFPLARPKTVETTASEKVAEQTSLSISSIEKQS